MSPSNRSAQRPRAADDELLGRLGLDGSASDDQVEAAHDEIAAFLGQAPAAVRVWARARLDEADEAYVLLRGPGDASANGDDLSVVEPVERPPTPAPRPAHPAPEPNVLGPTRNGQRNGNHARSAMLGDALGGGAWYEVDEDEPPEPARERAVVAPVRGRGAARRQVVSRRGDRLEVVESRRRLSLGGLRRPLLAGGAVVALAAVLFVGYQLGQPSVPGLTGSPAPLASGPVVDQAQVSAFMTRIAADANDTEALQGLANVYFAAGDFATASVWLEKLLALEPEDVDALLGYGAAAYNLGKLDEAKEVWLKVVALEPDNVEAHYDLGFLYLAQEPPDYALVEQEWRTVVELDPDSEIAKTVAAHLEAIAALASGAPSGSPGASPAPTPSAAPSTAPAASPGS